MLCVDVYDISINEKYLMQHYFSYMCMLCVDVYDVLKREISHVALFFIYVYALCRCI